MSEQLGRVESPLALISLERSFYRAAADILRGQHVELLADDLDAIGGIGKDEVLRWRDSMAQHCHGDLHHLLRGPCLRFVFDSFLFLIDYYTLSMMGRLLCIQTLQRIICTSSYYNISIESETAKEVVEHIKVLVLM